MAQLTETRKQNKIKKEKKPGILKRVWLTVDDRTGLSRFVGPILVHKVPRENWKTAWWYVFGSGALVAFIVQVVTGMALATSYVTSTSDAYNSLQFITNDAVMGNLLRGMHFFGSSAMVLIVGLHMIHVFLIGSYKYPREAHWLSGVVLLAVTLGMAFTGQLLRWDNNAIWSLVVGASQAARTPILGDQLSKFILAGDTIGGATLSRFFSFHVFFIPALIFIFIGLHLFLVLRNGISNSPSYDEEVDPKTYRKWYHDLVERDGVPFWPDAAWKDVAFSIVVIVGIAGAALMFGPPELDRPPDPTILQAYPRPDWYFLWYFSVLALIPSGVESYVILLFPAFVGIMMILLPFVANKGMRHPLRRPWAIGIVLVTVLMIVTLWIVGLQAPWSPVLEAKELPPKVIGTAQPTTTVVAANVPVPSASPQANSPQPGQNFQQVQSGALLFNQKGCEYCHMVGGYGGLRGPNLTNAGNRLTTDQITIRILNGGNNMPAYGSTLKPGELEALLAFIKSRKG